MKFFRTSVFFLFAATSNSFALAETNGLRGVQISLDASRKPYSMTKSSDEVARVGKTSQRFELQHDDCYDEDCSNDRRRVEYQQKNEDTDHCVGKTVWYGWSLFLTKDFPDLAPTNTILGQVQMHGWRAPTWSFNLRDGALNFNVTDLDSCRAASLSEVRGRWTDIVVKATYEVAPTSGNTIEAWINGKMACSSRAPLVTQEMLNRSPTDALRFKYGIYNSYVSRWLQNNAKRSVAVEGFADNHEDSGEIILSPTSKPFDYDWGVRLPTQIAYYDAVRIGKKREDVEIGD